MLLLVLVLGLGLVSLPTTAITIVYIYILLCLPVVIIIITVTITITINDYHDLLVVLVALLPLSVLRRQESYCDYGLGRGHLASVSGGALSRRAMRSRPKGGNAAEFGGEGGLVGQKVA